MRNYQKTFEENHLVKVYLSQINPIQSWPTLACWTDPPKNFHSPTQPQLKLGVTK